MYQLIPISDDTVWQPTLNEWRESAIAQGDEGIFVASDTAQRLTWLRQQAEDRENAHCYFLVERGKTVASALLEVAHAMPTSDRPWLKLLSVTLAPSLLPNSSADESVLKAAFQVLAASIVHSIELIFHQLPSRELKIFGRTQEMRTLFKAIISAGNLDPSLESVGLSAKLEGKWLVLRKI